MLQALGLAVSVGGRLVVEGADFTVMPKDKVGLVGRNGAGKTSLFRVLGGHAEPAAGRVIRKGGFGYLPQDPRIDAAADARTAVTHVLSGRGVDAEIERIEKLRIAMEEHPDERAVARYSRAEELFRANGGYAAESEARAIAAGLGLDASRQDLPVGVLSGGERRRAEIARILFAGSDVLLLDEPTNHLDVDAKEWLLGFLRTLSRRAARDQPRPRTARRGDHPGARTSTARARRRPEHSSSTGVPTRSTCTPAPRTSDAPPRSPPGRARRSPGCRPSSTASAPRRRRRRWRTASRSASPASRTTASRSAKGDRTLRVRFPAPPAAGRTVIEAVGLTKAYGGPDIFADVSFDLGRGERLLVLGLNGAGKTSLLRILAGETAADRGTFQFGHNVTAGYYAQEHDNLRVGDTLLDNIRAEVPPGVTLTETELRGLLGMFGLSGDKVFQEAGTLSGGEKTKLALAMLMVGRNNLLLLDEPTNNLDPRSRTAVADALSDWPGSIIFVSHDTEFVEQLAPDQGLADAGR